MHSISTPRRAADADEMRAALAERSHAATRTARARKLAQHECAGDPILRADHRRDRAIADQRRARIAGQPRGSGARDAFARHHQCARQRTPTTSARSSPAISDAGDDVSALTAPPAIHPARTTGGEHDPRGPSAATWLHANGSPWRCHVASWRPSCRPASNSCASASADVARKATRDGHRANSDARVEPDGADEAARCTAPPDLAIRIAVAGLVCASRLAIAASVTEIGAFELGCCDEPGVPIGARSRAT